MLQNFKILLQNKQRRSNYPQQHQPYLTQNAAYVIISFIRQSYLHVTRNKDAQEHKQNKKLTIYTINRTLKIYFHSLFSIFINFSSFFPLFVLF
jgi:hypothetical protein